MNRLFFIFFLFLLLPLIQSCVSSKKTITKDDIMRDDPLIGKIIDSNKRVEISFGVLLDEISSKDVIYLAEKHDNPDHHRFQEKVLQSLVDMGLTPTIGFEFFSHDKTSDLLNFVDSAKAAHSQKDEKFIENHLRKKLGWDTQSDKSWAYYFSLLKIAKKNNLPAAGIDLGSALRKRIVRKGLKGISPLESDQLFSTNFNDPVYKEYMFSIFKAVHCGMGHVKMQQKIYDTWLARNDKMAGSINRLVKYKKGPVVIIIGGGHTEHGLGVIDRLNAINPEIKQVNVGLREISVNPSGLADYLVPLDLEGFKASPPFDYVWFTQRVSYDDPCEKFKESLKKMKSQ